MARIKEQNEDIFVQISSNYSFIYVLVQQEKVLAPTMMASTCIKVT